VMRMVMMVVMVMTDEEEKDCGNEFPLRLMMVMMSYYAIAFSSSQAIRTWDGGIL